MLSAESAAGKYPTEAVTMQQLIINQVEVITLNHYFTVLYCEILYLAMTLSSSRL